MVKHGRAKKLRSGRVGRTKLKNRTYRRWNPNPKFGDKTVKKLWDVSKSPSVNLANMGLLAKPNQDVKRVNEAPRVNENANVVELFDIPDSDTLAANKKKHPMKEEDQAYIAKGLAKYADNYGKIFRDLKVNPMQHTENQLRKMGARYLLLSPEQRAVPLPEKVEAITA